MYNIVPFIPIARISVHVRMPLDPFVYNPLVSCNHWASKMHHSLIHLSIRLDLNIYDDYTMLKIIVTVFQNRAVPFVGGTDRPKSGKTVFPPPPSAMSDRYTIKVISLSPPSNIFRGFFSYSKSKAST